MNGTITGATEAARQVVELAKGGFKFQASVGVAPIEYERVRPNDTVQVNGRAVTAGRSGFTLVKASVLREVSIVAIGADAGTSVAIAAQRKEGTMNEHGTMTIWGCLTKQLGTSAGPRCGRCPTSCTRCR